MPNSATAFDVVTPPWSNLGAVAPPLFINCQSKLSPTVGAQIMRNLHNEGHLARRTPSDVTSIQLGSRVVEAYKTYHYKPAAVCQTQSSMEQPVPPLLNHRVDPILFYDPVPPYGWLSTYSPHSIHVDGANWSTVEHYFQAQKFHDPYLRESIRRCATPASAKALGWQWVAAQRSDWEAVRETVMLRALRYKFHQHQNLHDQLLSTGGIPIIEDSEDDLYWGRGWNQKGANRLGHLLMLVRSTSGSLRRGYQ